MNKKNILLILLIAIITSIGIALSYAFIGKANVIGNEGNLTGDIKDVEGAYSVSLPDDNNISLDINLEDLKSANASNAYSSYIESTFDTYISITSDKNKVPNGVTCNYDIYYIPETVYVASDNAKATGLLELAILGTGPNGEKFGPISLDSVRNKYKLYSSEIASNPNGSTVKIDWHISLRFYNLLIEQSSALGQNPTGKVVIELGRCREQI